MAQKPVVILDTVGPTLDVPQGTDTYLMAEDVAITGNLSITGTVDGRDVAADGTTLDGAVLESDYNAQTILAATTDNTPAALTVGEQTLVGRITSGNVAALSATQVRTLLNVADGATVGAFTAGATTAITPTTPIVLDEATGNEVALNIAYQVNKATSGNDTGLVINQTDTASPGTSLLADFQVASVSKFSVSNAIGFYIGTDAADTVAQRNGTTAQTFNIYRTYTDASNYEVGFIKWNGNLLEVGTDEAGTGAVRSIAINSAEYIYFGDRASGSAFSYMAIRDGIGTVAIRSDLQWAWSSVNNNAAATADTGFARSAAAVVKVTNGSTGSGKLIAKDVSSIAGDEAAGNVGSFTNIKSAIATVSSSAAATLTATNLIPAGCFLMGITARITTTFGNSTGLTTFEIGDGSDVNRWGTAIARTSGTTVSLADATAQAGGWFIAATSVVLTANGGNFDATGVIELIAHYIDLTAPTG